MVTVVFISGFNSREEAYAYYGQNLMGGGKINTNPMGTTSYSRFGQFLREISWGGVKVPLPPEMSQHYRATIISIIESLSYRITFFFFFAYNIIIIKGAANYHQILCFCL